jgi:hypothetical protein
LGRLLGDARAGKIDGIEVGLLIVNEQKWALSEYCRAYQKRVLTKTGHKWRLLLSYSGCISYQKRIFK